jgi:hypothetical protein
MSTIDGFCKVMDHNYREMQADEESAKAHFKQADKEYQDADKAETFSDFLRHTKGAIEEGAKGDADSQRADQHRDDAFKNLGKCQDEQAARLAIARHPRGSAKPIEIFQPLRLSGRPGTR